MNIEVIEREFSTSDLNALERTWESLSRQVDESLQMLEVNKHTDLW